MGDTQQDGRHVHCIAFRTRVNATVGICVSFWKAALGSTGLPHSIGLVHDAGGEGEKMKRASAIVLTLAIVVPTSLLAKGQIVKITITGADLTAPIEITDFGNLKDVEVNVWAGPGVTINGKEQTEGFIIDWPHGVAADRPSGLPHYEVAFYAKLDEVRLVYVVSYDFNPSSEQGYIYLPGRHDKWFNLNCGTICHGDGFEGNWFRATKAWDSAATSLITRAKITRSSAISVPQGQQDDGKAHKCRDDARRRVELVDISRQNDGLHKAAVANNGYYLQSDDGLPWNRFSLEGLVHSSNAVFVGTVQDSRSELEQHGRYIHTRYSVEIEQILKGSLQPGQVVSFLLPGGKVTFDDGTVAEVRKEGEPPLLKDHRYALFTLDSTEEAGLRPVGADEGVFELISDGSVSPRAYYSWDSLQAAKQLTQEQFPSKVQIAAQEEKR